MVVDTSALVTILQAEPGYLSFIKAIEKADSRRISAATLVEASIVIESRFGPDGLRYLDALISRLEFELIPVDSEQAYLAREAFSRFGKGRHRASLNYGDCFSYALARLLGESLLCKGADFVRTDALIASL